MRPLLSCLLAAMVLTGLAGTAAGSRPAAAAASLGTYNLQPSDIPTGFYTRKSAVDTAAQWANGNPSTSVAQLTKAGVQMVSLVQYSARKVPSAGIVEIDSYIFAMSTVAHARAMMPALSAMPKAFTPIKAQGLGALGQAREAFALNTRTGYTTEDLMFVRGHYGVQLLVAFKGKDQISRTLALARAVDARLKHAS